MMILLFCVALTWLLMLAGHWAIMRILSRKLHRLESYVLGTGLGILLPFTLWGWLTGIDWEIIAALYAVTAGAGFGTALAWFLDWIGGKRATTD